MRYRGEANFSRTQSLARRNRAEVHCGTSHLPSYYLPSVSGPQFNKSIIFCLLAASSPNSSSTCLRNTDGLISSELQISKMLRREGFVLPSSMRLINARSYQIWLQGLLGSSSTVIDDSVAAVRTLRRDRGSDYSLQKAPQPNVAPQVYYLPLIILAAVAGANISLRASFLRKKTGPMS
jgi:hypothetical protein